jgi:hypothetical protein
VIPGHPDLLLQSLLESQFVASVDSIDMQSWMIASWIHIAVLVISAALVVFLMRGGRDFGAAIKKRFPGFTQAVTSDFGLGRLCRPLVLGIVRVGELSQRWIDEGVWNRWVPWLMRKGLGSIGVAAFRSDTYMIRGLNEGVRRGVEIPSRVLQLVQSGDLQWYLFFAVGSVVAILLHFLRF